VTRFQMQAWSSSREGWENMEDGPGPWKPRDSAAEAVEKCQAWTGGLGIPAMQVVDLADGRIVWRDGHPIYEADAGKPIAFDRATAEPQLSLAEVGQLAERAGFDPASAMERAKRESW
jgi:hypothetical protein